jgi:uncharacterized membrane protein YeiH
MNSKAMGAIQSVLVGIIGGGVLLWSVRNGHLEFAIPTHSNVFSVICLLTVAINAFSASIDSKSWGTRVVAAFVVGLGGGTLRNLSLYASAPGWMHDSSLLLAVSVGGLLAGPLILMNPRVWLADLDRIATLTVAVLTVLNPLAAHHPWWLNATAAIMTAVGGGLIMDVLIPNRRMRWLSSEVHTDLAMVVIVSVCAALMPNQTWLMIGFAIGLVAFNRMIVSVFASRSQLILIDSRSVRLMLASLLMNTLMPILVRARVARLVLA